MVLGRLREDLQACHYQWISRGAPEIDAAGQLPLPGWLWCNPIAILTGLVLGDGMRT